MYTLKLKCVKEHDEFYIFIMGNGVQYPTRIKQGHDHQVKALASEDRNGW